METNKLTEFVSSFWKTVDKGQPWDSAQMGVTLVHGNTCNRTHNTAPIIFEEFSQKVGSGVSAERVLKRGTYRHWKEQNGQRWVLYEVHGVGHTDSWQQDDKAEGLKLCDSVGEAASQVALNGMSSLAALHGAHHGQLALPPAAPPATVRIAREHPRRIAVKQEGAPEEGDPDWYVEQNGKVNAALDKLKSDLLQLHSNSVCQKPLLEMVSTDDANSRDAKVAQLLKDELQENIQEGAEAINALHKMTSKAYRSQEKTEEKAGCLHTNNIVLDKMQKCVRACEANFPDMQPAKKRARGTSKD